jgi:hypoxanthine phosphoribosyltransferase
MSEATVSTLPDNLTVLYSADQIRDRIMELAGEITADFAEETPVLIGMLKGSYMFVADLSRALPIPHHVDFMAVAAYGSGTSAGSLRLLKDLSVNITGRAVIIVDDIVDTGATLNHVRLLLEARQPKRLAAAALLDKKGRRRTDVPIDYVGFEIGEGFVVGYGLDLAERYRHLPYVALIDPSKGEETRSRD